MVTSGNAFNPDGFFTVARQLTSDSVGEANLRTAVGRAYYSVFLVARNRLGVGDKTNVHAKVIARLKAVDRTAGDQLDRLRDLRELADYELRPQPIDVDWLHNWGKALSLRSSLSSKLPTIVP